MRGAENIITTERHEVTYRQEIFGHPEQYIAMPPWRAEGTATDALHKRVEQLVRTGITHTVDGMTVAVRTNPGDEWTDRVDIYTYTDIA